MILDFFQTSILCYIAYRIDKNRLWVFIGSLYLIGCLLNSSIIKGFIEGLTK